MYKAQNEMLQKMKDFENFRTTTTTGSEPNY